MLGRRDLATRLTKLIQSQTAPFVISIDGNWGTGKTFLLQRWQSELEKEGFKAIYFNAWEDDFCDDPLLAILGQLSEYFEEGELKRFAGQVANVAGPLLKQNLLSVLHKHTGLVLEIESKEQPQRNLLQEYLDQRATKDELKNHLQKLSNAVVNETGHPLVFIIDELDRCRPTFAIELLERVKHIFDVPNLVFVFGVNRDELCSALQSIYGDIDAEVYLRRFFDLEFMLPETNPADFCRNLLDRFQFAEFFSELGKNAGTNLHDNEFRNLSEWIPIFWSGFGMSLRDMDYCVRTIALVCRSLEPRHYMYSYLLSVLIPLRLTNQSLYRQFIQGDCHASAVMDYLDRTVQITNSSVGYAMDVELIMEIIEVELYRAESQRDEDPQHRDALLQIRLLSRGEDMTQPSLVSEKTRRSDKNRIDSLLRLYSPQGMQGYSGDAVDHVARMIDLHQTVLRK